MLIMFDYQICCELHLCSWIVLDKMKREVSTEVDVNNNY